MMTDTIKKRLNKFSLNPFDQKLLANFNDNEFKNKVPDLFINDNNEITNKQKRFYNEILFPNYDDLGDFSSLLSKGSRSYFTKCLDKEILQHNKILEVGCGTGQMSLFLSRFSRMIFGIDISKNSLSLAEKHRQKYGIDNVFFLRMNLFRILFKKNYFDYVISNGVLHHTEKCKKAYLEIIKFLKPGGFIVLGLYHKYGRSLTRLKQKLPSFFKKNVSNFDYILKMDISKKKKRAWELDQFYNPYESTHTLSETLDWFKESNIEFINSIPFTFSQNDRLFQKKLVSPKNKLLVREILETFSSSQIKKGGFFITIGKKKK